MEHDIRVNVAVVTNLNVIEILPDTAPPNYATDVKTTLLKVRMTSGSMLPTNPVHTNEDSHSMRP